MKLAGTLRRIRTPRLVGASRVGRHAGDACLGGSAPRRPSSVSGLLGAPPPGGCCWDWENGGDGDHGDREGAAEATAAVAAWRLARDASAATVPEEDAEARTPRRAGGGDWRFADKLAGEMLDRRTDEVNAAEQQGGVGQAVATVAGEVIDTLLGCMEDYCTDNRGDGVLGAQARWSAPAAVAAAAAKVGRDGGSGGGGGDCFATGAKKSAVDVVSALLKSCGKIDRTRAAAAGKRRGVPRAPLRRTPSGWRTPVASSRSRRLLAAIPTDETEAAAGLRLAFAL